MVEGIRIEELQKVFGIEAPVSECQLTFCIVAKRSPRFKKIAFAEDLGEEQRQEKLNKWADEKRFVSIIHAGNAHFAAVHEQHLNRLSGQPLSFEDMVIDEIKGLSDESYEKVNVTAKLFAETILLSDLPVAKKTETPQPSQPSLRQYFAVRCLIADQMHTQMMISKLELIPGEIINRVQEKLSQIRQDEAERKEESERYFEIRRTQINRQILKSEITDTTIKSLFVLLEELTSSIEKMAVHEANLLQTN